MRRLIAAAVLTATMAPGAIVGASPEAGEPDTTTDSPSSDPSGSPNASTPAPESTLDPKIETWLAKAASYRERGALNKAYRMLEKAYKRGGDGCQPCVLAFVDTDLAAGDLDAALDSAGVVWPEQDEIALLRRLAARIEGDEAWRVLSRLAWRLAEAGDIDQLIEVVEAYLDSHDHRVRASLCGAAFARDRDLAAKINEELDGLSWRGPFLIGGDVESPRGLTRAIPGPTARSLINGTSGDVHLFAVVSPRGRATTVRALFGLGDGLSERAERAVWEWRFAAGTRDGEPVATCVSIALRFPNRGL